MSTMVTPRTGPEHSRPNRRHCRQKSPVSSHLVPLSACHRRDSAGQVLADGAAQEEAHLDAPSPTLVAASAAHSPGSHRSYEPPQAGLPSGGAMSRLNRLPHRALAGGRIPMGWLAVDAVADALELLSRAKVRCDTKMFFWGGCEVPIPGDQVTGLGPGPGPCAAGLRMYRSYRVRLHFLMRKGAGDPLKSFATPDSRRAATRLDASLPLRSAPRSFHPDFIPPNRPEFRSSILVGGTCTTSSGTKGNARPANSSRQLPLWLYEVRIRQPFQATASLICPMQVPNPVEDYEDKCRK